jgi:hypothetical protein
MESRSEKRGCIWLVRLLSPNTCTPSTQQPNRHPLSERCLAPNSAVQFSERPVYFLSSFERSHSIMGNLISGPDGEPELALVQRVFVYLSHLSPLYHLICSCSRRSLPNLGLGSCSLACARRSAGIPLFLPLLKSVTPALLLQCSGATSSLLKGTMISRSEMTSKRAQDISQSRWILSCLLKG